MAERIPFEKVIVGFEMVFAVPLIVWNGESVALVISTTPICAVYFVESIALTPTATCSVVIAASMMASGESALCEMKLDHDVPSAFTVRTYTAEVVT